MDEDVFQILGRMSHVPLSPDILSGFGLDGSTNTPPCLLDGGAGTTYLLPDANAVLKPTHDTVETNIICNILSQLDNNDPAFRIARPLKSTAGSFVYKDWSASSYIPDVRPLNKHRDEYTLDRLKDIMKASTAFHIALTNVKLSDTETDHLRHNCNHVWARAHQALWSDEKDPQALLAPFAPGSASDKAHPYSILVKRLVDLAGKLQDAPVRNKQLYHHSSQIIHADVVGGDNVLFPILESINELCPSLQSPSSAQPLAIIDLSPTLGPPSYAEGILLADAMIWCGAGSDIFDLTADGPTRDGLDMIRRGLMFRCLSDIGLIERGRDDAKPDIVEVERCTGLLEQWVADANI